VVARSTSLPRTRRLPGGGLPLWWAGPIGPELEMTADVALHLQADDAELTRRLQTVH